MLLLAGRRSGDAHNRVPKKKRLNAEPCHHAVTTNQEKDRTYGRVASVSYTSSCHNFEHTSIVLGALPPRRHHNFKRIELGSVREEHIFFFSPLHFEEIKYILATQPSPKKKKISVARVPWSSLTRRVHHNHHHHHHHYHQVPHVKSTRQSVAMANNAAQETSKRTPTVKQQKQQQHHPTKKQQQQQDGGRPDNNNNNSNNNMPPRRLYWVGNPLFALTPVLLSSSSTPSTSSTSTSSTPSSSTSTKGTHDQPRQIPPLPPASLPFASSSSVHKNHHNKSEKNGGHQAEREEEQQEEEEEKRKEKSLWDHRGAKMRKPSLGSEMGKNRENGGGGGGGGTAAATATARKDVKM